jgi:hypothetical protein
MLCHLTKVNTDAIIILHSVDKVFFENDQCNLCADPREAYIKNLTRMANLLLEGWDLVVYSPISGWVRTENSIHHTKL